MNTQRLQMLRRQVTSLQSHQSKLEQELSALVERHEQRKRRYKDSFTALREQLEQQRRLEQPAPAVAATSSAVSSASASTSCIASSASASSCTPSALQSEAKSETAPSSWTSAAMKRDPAAPNDTPCDAATNAVAVAP